MEEGLRHGVELKLSMRECINMAHLLRRENADKIQCCSGSQPVNNDVAQGVISNCTSPRRSRESGAENEVKFVRSKAFTLYLPGCDEFTAYSIYELRYVISILLAAPLKVTFYGDQRECDVIRTTRCLFAELLVICVFGKCLLGGR